MSNQDGDHKFIKQAREALNYQREWRQRNQILYSYYDGDQWTAEEKEELETRHQQASVLNITRPIVDMIMALEQQRRTDRKVVARERTDEDISDVLTHLLKQIEDENSSTYFEAQAFRQAIIGGAGWLQYSEKKDSSGRSQIIDHHVPWEEVFWDPFMRRPDAVDARYIIRRVWMDVAEAVERWPNKKKEIESEHHRLDILFGQLDDEGVEFEGQEFKAQLETAFFLSAEDRQRIGISDHWYRDPKDDNKVHQVMYFGNIFLKGSEDGENPSPYENDFYPLVPCFASRKIDGTPIGAIEIVRPIQDMLNKANSKFQWTISSLRVLYEVEAVHDESNLRDEIAKPNSLIPLNPGALAGQKISISDSFQESSHLMEWMQFLIQMAQRSTGVNDAVLGFGGVNARSSIQESGRIIQGAQMQTSLIENLFFTKKQAAKVKLMLIGQYYDDERIVRVLGPGGEEKILDINSRITSSETGEQMPLNEIKDILKYDVVLTEVKPFDTVRQQSLQMLSEVAKAFPSPVFLKIFLENMDIPNKEQYIKEFNQELSQGPAGAQGIASPGGQT